MPLIVRMALTVIVGPLFFVPAALIDSVVKLWSVLLLAIIIVIGGCTYVLKGLEQRGRFNRTSKY